LKVYPEKFMEVWTQDDIAVMRDPKAEEANVVDVAK
jgi:hypothetical protein